MTAEQRILQVLHDFINAGLIMIDIEKVVGCMSERILGIGIGEQGFVTSLEDVRNVLRSGVKEASGYSHQIRYGRTEVLLHSDCFATVCAEICVVSQKDGEEHIIESRFNQLLTLIYEENDWKICALHASTPVLTEESAEAYPLKIAENTLQSLKKKIGEQIYSIEEQYRQAILSDTIAFYIVNLTRDIFEKCQCNSDLCATVDEGDSYSALIESKLPEYVIEEDKHLFHEKFSLENLVDAFESMHKEVQCEYRLKNRESDPIWVLSVARLIFDPDSKDLKAIIYVRNIHQRKMEELALQRMASYDGMTGVYNKDTMMQMIHTFLNRCDDPVDCAFVMVDVDDFKGINDNYGHPAGDQVLVRVAELLRQYFGDNEITARIGGDEFAVFIPNVTDKEHILYKLDTLRTQISEIKINNNHIMDITGSIGIAFCGTDSSFDELYTKADNALYRSKKNGKNQVAEFSA